MPTKRHTSKHTCMHALHVHHMLILIKQHDWQYRTYIVSRANTHSWVSTHVPHFKCEAKLQVMHMHGCLPRTLWCYSTSKWKLWYLKVDLYKAGTYNLHYHQNYMHVVHTPKAWKWVNGGQSRVIEWTTLSWYHHLRWMHRFNHYSLHVQGIQFAYIT